MLVGGVSASGPESRPTGESESRSSGEFERQSSGESEPQSSGQSEPRPWSQSEPRSSGQPEPQSWSQSEPQSSDPSKLRPWGQSEPRFSGQSELPSSGQSEPRPWGHSEPRFSWPLAPPPQVTRGFEAPVTEYGPGHRGVDLAATPGQPVLAAGPGVVVFAGQVAGQGVVSIDHDGGLRTTYEPLTPTVPAGTQVYGGQQIGLVNPGHPGCPVAACLHWGVRRGEEDLNPLALIRTESVIRLKPWEPP